jgi:hypothetical protein
MLFAFALAAGKAAIIGICKAAWDSVLRRFCPAKTAVDQRLADELAANKEARNAQQITEKVERESDGALDAALAGRMRHDDT